MSIITEIKWAYLKNHTYFRVCTGAIAKIGKNVIIRNSRIIVTPGSSIVIGNHAVIENTIISVVDGNATIGDYSLIGGTANTLLNVEKGEIHIGHHSKISARRFWVRFGGVVKIGNYTNINEASEIRCDDNVTIGDYNQISYGVNIWDTNTHSIYSPQKRRELAEKYYPFFGKEVERPKSLPVKVGNDCWLGERVALLKGTTLGDGVIVGYGTIIAGKHIPDGFTVVSESILKLIETNR